MTHENQASVYGWIEESYPGASMRRRLKHAFEELMELAIRLDPEIDVAQLQAIIAHTAEKSLAQTDDGKGVAGEIGDVRISLIGIASAAGIDEQAALDEVMAANRERTLAERQAREGAKLRLEIFQP